MTDRYRVTICHGDSASVYHAVDTSQPEDEQPCVVRSWSTAQDHNAAYMAQDFCDRHNAK